MSVLVKLCVGVVSAAILSVPDVLFAGESRVVPYSVQGDLASELSRADYVRATEQARRKSVTVVSDLPPFQLGSREESRRRTIEGEVRPYLSPGRKLGVKKQRLPDQCLRIVETNRGDRLTYSARCLNRQYRHASHLPRDCRAYVRGLRTTTVVYRAGCLAKDGRRVARR